MMNCQISPIISSANVGFDSFYHCRLLPSVIYNHLYHSEAFFVFSNKE